MDGPCCDVFELEGGRIKRFDCCRIRHTRRGQLRNELKVMVSPAMSLISINDPEDLPVRNGDRPRVHPGPPQHQLDQLPTEEEWQTIRKMFNAWQTAEQGASLRATPGTLGLFIPENDRKASSAEAFLLGNEFAHHHPKGDGGLHLVLPPAWHAIAIKRGWAVPHTLAGHRTVSHLTLLIFAPRDADERNVIRRLVEVSESFARGAEHERQSTH
jgi:hypothetical protein